MIRPVQSINSTNTLLNKMYEETSKGYTENGALTFTRTKSSLVDFFAQAGGMRDRQKEALGLFINAFSEDKEKAIRILFYFRDIRGGQGERELFRTCIKWLGEYRVDVFNSIVKYIPEYGRWDDMFFDNPQCISIIKEQLLKDSKSETPSLLAKWLPTINASSKTTKAKALWMAKNLGLKEVEYRKMIRGIRKNIKTVEEKMSGNMWDEIDYSTVPSQASRIYRNAFMKHDVDRYIKFIQSVRSGNLKINASTLYPYQIYEACENDYSDTLDALWKNLPDYTNNKNAIVVADTSGSMDGRPMAVSVSLALYFAERNKGLFQNYFISFSENPKLHFIKGSTLPQKMRSIRLGNIANTDIQKVFDLILNTAVENNISQDEMPEVIYIISDMEFDEACVGKTNHDVIKEKYSIAGYKKPNLVFWNVNATGHNLPVYDNEAGVSLVSGLSPSIFKMAVENKTPIQVMLDVINSDRYSNIKI